SFSDAATRNAERRMMLESELRARQDRLAALKRNSYQTAGGSRLSDLDRQIGEYESGISAMKDRYTDDFPDLQAARERLAVLRKQRDEALKDAGKNDSHIAESPAAERDGMDAEQSVEAVQTQLKALALEERDTQRGMVQVNAALKRYQDRIESMPA